MNLIGKFVNWDGQNCFKKEQKDPLEKFEKDQNDF